ncbi:MAG: 6-bladed beta-propeller, partial [Bacteroidales bacterium]
MKSFIKVFIATVGFYILLSGCSSNSNRVVKLIPTLSDSLTFTAETQIVKLETSPGCNLGIIDKVLTDNKGNRIIIASDDNLYIFDGKGKFLCKLKQGKGPNEVSRIMTFSINKEKELIYAVDMASLIVVIDYDGNIIDKFS